jgi:hypothetical protein
MLTRWRKRPKMAPKYPKSRAQTLVKVPKCPYSTSPPHQFKGAAPKNALKRFAPPPQMGPLVNAGWAALTHSRVCD